MAFMGYPTPNAVVASSGLASRLLVSRMTPRSMSRRSIFLPSEVSDSMFIPELLLHIYKDSVAGTDEIAGVKCLNPMFIAKIH